MDPSNRGSWLIAPPVMQTWGESSCASGPEENPNKPPPYSCLLTECALKTGCAAVYAARMHLEGSVSSKTAQVRKWLIRHLELYMISKTHLSLARLMWLRNRRPPNRQVACSLPRELRKTLVDPRSNFLMLCLYFMI